jgi:isopenicillin-N N-acyltransferase-like protein
MTRYREIKVAGLPRQMGRQIGEAAGEEIRAFCEMALPLVNKQVRVSHQAARQIAARSLVHAERYAPNLVEELGGMAEAARVSLEDLMLLQVRNQLQPEADAACTSLALAGREGEAGGLVAQNWDNHPELHPVTIVLTRRPKDQPALMTVTQAGLIAYIGFSEAGIGLCLNTLPAPSRPVGVPHYFTVRGIYEADSLPAAVHAVERAERAIPANIMMITPQGPADLEVTLGGVHVLTGAHLGHANHCRHPELLSINEQFPELIQSHARQRRIDGLLSELSPAMRIEEVKRILRDHSGFPRSICRHANEDQGTGFWETIFSVIIEPSERRMLISRGTPCQNPYESYVLN